MHHVQEFGLAQLLGVPAKGLGAAHELRGALLQAHQQPRLAAPGSIHQEAQRHQRLARARRATNQGRRRREQPPAQQLAQPGDGRAGAPSRERRLADHHGSQPGVEGDARRADLEIMLAVQAGGAPHLQHTQEPLLLLRLLRVRQGDDPVGDGKLRPLPHVLRPILPHQQRRHLPGGELDHHVDGERAEGRGIADAVP